LKQNNILKYQYIDFLRGVAILNVIAVHSYINVANLNLITAWIFNYGQLGVQLFFVASAITLCFSMLHRNESNLINFYIRRYFRIAPLYYFAIFFYFSWIILKSYYNNRPFEIPDEYSLFNVLANIFFVHGFFPSSFNSSVPGGWSIATEMTFYLMFPFIFYLQKGMETKAFISLSALIIFILLIFKISVIYFIQPFFVTSGLVEGFKLEYGYINFSILNQLSVFIVGMITFRLIVDRTLVVKSVHIALAILLTITSCWLLNSKDYIHNPISSFLYPLLSAISFGLLALRLSTVNEFSSVISKVVIKIGKYSFSIYIFHFFVLDLITHVVKRIPDSFFMFQEFKLALLFFSVALITSFIAKFSYQYVECKGIDLGHKIIGGR